MSEKKWNENKTAEIKAGLREESAKEGRSQGKEKGEERRKEEEEEERRKEEERDD